MLLLGYHLIHGASQPASEPIAPVALVILTLTLQHGRTYKPECYATASRLLYGIAQDDCCCYYGKQTKHTDFHPSHEYESKLVHPEVICIINSVLYTNGWWCEHTP